MATISKQHFEDVGYHSSDLFTDLQFRTRINNA